VARGIGGGDAVHGRFGGVQLFGIGRIAQEFPQPGCLRAGAAQGVPGGLAVQFKQVAHRHGRGQGAGGGGGVENAVMARTQEFADANAAFVAGHHGRDPLLP